jgi:replicative DNA helicase
MARIETGHGAPYTLEISARDDQVRFLHAIGGDDPAHDRLAAVLDRAESTSNLDTVPTEIWQRVREVLEDRTPVATAGTTRMAQVATVLDTAELDLHATNDVLWDEVVSIEEIGERDVFDATVLALHNFVANGIVAHNSIEQDADVVILLHRDDYYDKESPRAGEADFIVAKHRNGPTDTVTVAAQLHFSRFVDMAV